MRWVLAYKFARFVEKLHEIEKVLVLWGGGAPATAGVRIPTPSPSISVNALCYTAATNVPIQWVMQLRHIL